jgi:hypothetical protein
LRIAVSPLSLHPWGEDHVRQSVAASLLLWRRWWLVYTDDGAAKGDLRTIWKAPDLEGYFSSQFRNLTMPWSLAIWVRRGWWSWTVHALNSDEWEEYMIVRRASFWENRLSIWYWFTTSAIFLLCWIWNSSISLSCFGIWWFNNWITYRLATWWRATAPVWHTAMLYGVMILLD